MSKLEKDLDYFNMIFKEINEDDSDDGYGFWFSQLLYEIKETDSTTDGKLIFTL